MELIKLNLKEFIESVDSIEPTPGGGSVSALAGSLGIALTRMVGHLTVGKKRFLKIDEKEQLQFIQIIEEMVETKNELLKLVDEDTDAYNEIVAAYKLPKDSDKEIALRNNKIQEGTIKSINVPYKVVLLSFNALQKVQTILPNGNPNTVSDLGVAALTLSTSIQGAAMNVLINLPGLNDEELRIGHYEAMKRIIGETQTITSKILNKVYSKLQI